MKKTTEFVIFYAVNALLFLLGFGLMLLIFHSCSEYDKEAQLQSIKQYIRNETLVTYDQSEWLILRDGEIQFKDGTIRYVVDSMFYGGMTIAEEFIDHRVDLNISQRGNDIVIYGTDLVNPDKGLYTIKYQMR